MMNVKTNKKNNLLPYLVLLLALFLFRVIAQFLQYLFNLSSLPPFESWDSGTLPYGILLAVQLAVVFALSKSIYKVSTHKITPNSKTGYILIASGAIYFTFMLLRLVAGLTILHDIKWFSYPIPSFFHLVLAAFLILFGYFHLINSGGESKCLE